MIKPTKAGGLTGQNDLDDINIQMGIPNGDWTVSTVQIEQSKLEMFPTKDEYWTLFNCTI
jgi:hypothetical protein